MEKVGRRRNQFPLSGIVRKDIVGREETVVPYLPRIVRKDVVRKGENPPETPEKEIYVYSPFPCLRAV